MSDSPFVFDWVREHATARPDAPAIGSPADGWTTYADLQQRVEATMSVLHHAGVAPGDFVVHALPSSTASVAAGLAVQALGAVSVEVSRDLSSDGVRDILRQTEASVAIVLGRDIRAWADTASRSTVRHLCIVHPSTPPDAMTSELGRVSWTWLPAGSTVSAAASVPSVTRRGAASTALLVYTSGSTGTPRAVIQTHANIDANTRAIARYLTLTGRDRAMATLPIFYCYGRSVLSTHLLVGASVFFDERFMYPAVVMDEIRRQRCTGFAGVPLTFESLRRQLSAADLDLPSLRYVTQAGGAMQPATVRWARETFAPAQLFVMYGQTEATARISFLPPEHADDKEGSVGRGLDNVELEVVDDNGAAVPTGTVGNIVARGPSITPGYFQAPDETAEILRDGWLFTGDLGHMDEDGFVFLTGRTKEMLKLSGHRVSAHEIETVIREHPDVHDVAVVGTIDSDGAEQAVAFIVQTDDGSFDETALRRHCRRLLPPFKVPKHLRFVDALPLTASNKVARSELQEWIHNDSNLLERSAPARPRGNDS